MRISGNFSTPNFSRLYIKGDVLESMARLADSKDEQIRTKYEESMRKLKVQGKERDIFIQSYGKDGKGIQVQYVRPVDIKDHGSKDSSKIIQAQVISKLKPKQVGDTGKLEWGDTPGEAPEALDIGERTEFIVTQNIAHSDDFLQGLCNAVKRFDKGTYTYRFYSVKRTANKRTNDDNPPIVVDAEKLNKLA